MNISLPVSWIRQYLKTDLAAKTIAQELSQKGPSVEKIEKMGNDYLFDIEMTSNRMDAASVLGVAREANAIFKTANHKTSLSLPKGLNLQLEPDKISELKLDVIIKDPNLCTRFTAIVVDSVKIKPSPAHIKNRLNLCKIRPINNIVDISNYLMLELGQPMHTFDYDKIKDAKMILRKSKQGEKITTLDGTVRKLPAGAIVIQDTHNLIDLCGIMGSSNSKVTSRTKRVVFFVQTYNSQLIRKTTQALTFRTDASTRFEKGIDPEGILPAISRAVYLAKQTAGAKIASELIDIYSKKQKVKTVRLNVEKLNKYLGIKLEASKASKILEHLGFRTSYYSDTIAATAPTWRAEDIESDVDLIEEIARIYGYHNLPSKLPEGEITQSSDDDLKAVIELKKALKYLGLTEVITYSIISKELLALAGLEPSNAVELENPLTDQWQFARSNVLVSLLSVLSQNQNIQAKMKIFEIAKTYLKKDGQLPNQDLMLSLAATESDFQKIKGIAENIFQILARTVQFSDMLEPNILAFDKKQSAKLKIADLEIGEIGQVKSEIADKLGIVSNVVALEINLTKVFMTPANVPTYKPVSKYPPVIEDVSAVFEVKTKIGDIIETFRQNSLGVDFELEIVDVFENKSLGEGKKSVTLRFTFQSKSHTPTKQEVENARDKIFDILAKQFQATVRR